MATEKLEPRARPSILNGYTQMVKTGDGKIYITLNYDDQGLREIFATIGRSGGTLASLAEAVGRSISMQLQYGVPIAEITRCLIGIRSTGCAEVDGVEYLSIPDAIGQILKNAPPTLPG